MIPNSSDPAIRPEGIGQIAIRVHDLGRATTFYRDVLGLDFLFEIPGAAFLGTGGIRIMLTEPESPEFDHPPSILYYRVPDLLAAHAALRERGVAFDSEPTLIARMPDHELWMAFLRDSEGNLLALMAEVAG